MEAFPGAVKNEKHISRDVLGLNGHMSYFVAVEGTDGSGKGLAAQIITDHIKRYYPDLSVVKTMEPYYESRLGKFVKDSIRTHRYSSSVEALLFASDRLNHCDKLIKPALDKGCIVVSERYIYSTFVYQCEMGDLDEEWVISINRLAPKPDLVIFVDADIDPVVMNRISSKFSFRANSNKTEYFEKKDTLIKIREMFLDVFGNRFNNLQTFNPYYHTDFEVVRNNTNNRRDLIDSLLPVIRQIVHGAREAPELRQQMIKAKNGQKTILEQEVTPVVLEDTPASARILEGFLMNAIRVQRSWYRRSKKRGLPPLFLKGNGSNIIIKLPDYEGIKSVQTMYEIMGNELNISRRTVQRYICALSDVGIVNLHRSEVNLSIYCKELAGFLKRYGKHRLVSLIERIYGESNGGMPDEDLELLVKKGVRELLRNTDRV